MKAFRYIAGVVAVMGLASCQNDDLDLVGYNSDPNAVRITAAVGHTLTRSNPTEEIGSEKATQFKAGDRISVSTEDQSAVIYVLEADNSWKPIDPNAYLVWNKSIHTFTAHYPADEYTGYESTRLIQDSEEDIAKADYMSFSGEFSNTGSISFEMERRTARVVIDEAQFSWGNQYIEGTNAIYEVKGIKIHAGDASGISLYKVGRKYYALVNPGAEKANAPFITLRVGPKQGYNGTEEELIIRGIPELTANTSYTFHLTIGKNKAELGKVEVEDWDASENIWGGTASDGYVAYVAFGGKMTYDIHTSDGFLEVNKLMANGTQADVDNAVINLYTDVTLPTPAAGESNWTPIGTEAWEIYSFNGNGHTIKGVVINNPDADYQGFLGRCYQVYNLTIEGLTVKGKEYVGGLTAYSSGGIIQNCTIKATENYPVLIEASSSKVGGLIGSCTNGTYSNCSVVCETGGSLTVKGSGQVGGIIGTNTDGTISKCNVTNNGTKFEISGGDRGNRVGGIVGQNTGPINDCNVTGISILGANYVGGFVGNTSGNITGSNTVKNCTISGWQTRTSITVGGTSGTPSVNITDGGGNNVVYTN